MFVALHLTITAMQLLFLALLLTPVVEIAVLISVGGVIGVPWTIAAILATAMLGTFLLRQQGLSLLLSAQREVERGEIPAGKLVEGGILAVGGALLLTPGFVTDAIGFLCLFPISRRGLAAWLARHFQGRAAMHVHSSVHYSGEESARNDSVTLEGEYKKEP